MVIDYNQRRAVTKNRPKKQPVSLLIPVVAVAVAVSFAMGLLSGWFLHKAKHPAPSIAGPAQGGGTPATEQPKAPVAAATGHNQPLTFYETLSKGNSNALIGSGLNPRQPGEPAPVHAPAAATSQASPRHPATPSVAPSPQPTATAPDVRTPPRETANEQIKQTPAEPAKDTKRNSAKPGSFTVQLGSYKDRKEAEAMLGRTAEKGLPGYIVEAKTQDKGTVFRVRIGKKLDQQTANTFAAKAGKGALVIPE